MKEELDVVVLKALSHEPQERYATAANLGADLAAYMAGHPISARSPTWRYTVRKFAGRHRAGVSVGALALLSILGMGGFSLWQTHQAQLAARQSERVTSFTQGVLRLLDPNHNPQHTDVSETLKAAVGKAQIELVDEPQVLERVLRELDGVIEHRNEDRALVVVREAKLDLARKLYGEGSRAVLEAMIELGIGQCHVYLYPQAIETLLPALMQLREVAGPQDKLYLLGKVFLARSYKHSRQYLSGLKFAKEVEAAFDGSSAWSTPFKTQLAFELLIFYHARDVARTRHWLDYIQRDRLLEQSQSVGERIQRTGMVADAQLFTGQLLAGDALMAEVLVEAARHYGEGSAEHARRLQDMANFDLLLGRFDQARQRLKRAWELRDESTASTATLFDVQRLANRGWVEYLADEIPATRDFMQQALASLSQGKRDSVRLHLLVTVAALRERNFEAAERGLDRVRQLGGADTNNDPTGVTLLLASVHQSNVLRLKGETQRALKTLQPAASRWRELYGDASYRGVQALGYEAMMLLEDGQVQKAAQTAFQAQQAADAAVGPNHPLGAQVRYIRAAALRRLGDRQTAQMLNDEAQAVIKSKLGKPLDERLMRVLY
jgi:tetratricopeptide (TPR) repeat protein